MEKRITTSQNNRSAHKKKTPKKHPGDQIVCCIYTNEPFMK